MRPSRSCRTQPHAISHLCTVPSRVGGAEGGTGGALGARPQPPTPPNKHGQRCTFNPFYWIFHRQKGAERRPRLSPAPGLPGRGGWGGGGAVFPLLPMGLGVGTDTGPRPPARQQHGLAYGTDTCYNATLPNTHRRAPGGPGGGRGGVGPPPQPRDRAGGAELSSAARC